MTLFPNPLNKRVFSIQNNQEDESLLISEYKNFILSTAKKYSRKSYITESDDEYSVALIAFGEAIKMYDVGKGNFLSFAKNIMKNRLIDFYRKNKKYLNTISIETNDDEENIEGDLTYKQSLSIYADSEIVKKKRLEIAQFKEELSDWDITLLDLVEASPKHTNTKVACKTVVNYILSNEEIVNHIFKKHTIPILEIQKNTKLPRKLIERFRKYLIAVLIIKKGDYEFLKDYITDWRDDK